MRDAAEGAAQEALGRWLDANIPAEQRSAVQGGGYADYAAAIGATPGLSVAPRPGGLPRLEMAAGGPPAEWCAGRDRDRGRGTRAGGGGRRTSSRRTAVPAAALRAARASTVSGLGEV